jgi:hypothetical protein
VLSIKTRAWQIECLSYALRTTRREEEEKRERSGMKTEMDRFYSILTMDENRWQVKFSCMNSTRLFQVGTRFVTPMRTLTRVRCLSLSNEIETKTSSFNTIAQMAMQESLFNESFRVIR